MVLVIWNSSGGGGGYSQGTAGSGTAGQGNDGGDSGWSTLWRWRWCTVGVTGNTISNRGGNGGDGRQFNNGQLQHLLVTMVIMSVVAVLVAPTMVEHTMKCWWTRWWCRWYKYNVNGGTINTTPTIHRWNKYWVEVLVVDVPSILPLVLVVPVVLVSLSLDMH